MSKTPLFFIVVVAIIAIAASYRFVQQRRERAANDAAPLQQLRATVSHKREKAINDRRSRQQQVLPAGSTMRYEAGFKPTNGARELTFRLEERQYQQLTVGDSGVLSYQGTRFMGFVADQ